jgi:hypothetical protein
MFGNALGLLAMFGGQGKLVLLATKSGIFGKHVIQRQNLILILERSVFAR